MKICSTNLLQFILFWKIKDLICTSLWIPIAFTASDLIGLEITCLLCKEITRHLPFTMYQLGSRLIDGVASGKVAFSALDYVISNYGRNNFCLNCWSKEEELVVAASAADHGLFVLWRWDWLEECESSALIYAVTLFVSCNRSRLFCYQAKSIVDK